MAQGSRAMLIIWTGSTGLSRRSVFVLLIFMTTSMPATTFPKTGCLEGLRSSRHQSKKSLDFVLMKNCDPPLLGRPVLAMLRVPG
jgi:hypothetical protein